MARGKYVDRGALIERLLNVWRVAVRNRTMSGAINCVLGEQIWDTEDYKRLTRADQAFIGGYALAYQQHVIDPQIEHGHWVRIPDGAEVFIAAGAPLPISVIDHRYVTEHSVRSGLYWKAPSALRGVHPYFTGDAGGGPQ